GGSTMKLRIALTLLLAALLPATALAGGPGGRHHGPNAGHHRHGILYAYEGTLAAAPSATNFTVNVERGNRAALQSLLGPSAQQTFTYDASTEFLLWSHGVPTI